MRKTFKYWGISSLLVLSLVVGIAGCGGDDGGGGSANITGDELMENVLLADADVETVKFDMDMIMKMDGDMMGQSYGMDMSMNGEGVMDNVEKKMKMEMDMSMDMDMGGMGDMDMDMDMEMYLIGDTMYMKMSEMMGMPEQWMKMDAGNTWEDQDMVAQQTDLLEHADLSISNGGKVNGEDTYKVVIVPKDLRSLYESMGSSLGMTEGLGTGLPSDIDMDEFEDMIKDFSVTQWYAKDTYFPMKAEMDITMVMTSDAAGMEGMGGDMNMEMEMTINFKDYNKSVSIELPNDARNAPDMGGLMDMGGMGF